MVERSDRPLTESYWEFLRLRNDYLAQPAPALAWWMAWADAPLNPTERLIFDFVHMAEHILDVGAGDERIKQRFRAAGLVGDYSTVDQSPEFEPDYRSTIDTPSGAFDAVLALEVIEHIPLAQFDEFMDEILRSMTPTGRLVISTPNAAYIGSIWEADMTHVHAYRVQDLAAYLHLRGFRCQIYRVVWQPERVSVKERVRMFAAKVLTRGILNLDFARGVVVLAERTGAAMRHGN